MINSLDALEQHKRNEEYQLSPQQQELDTQYKRVVEILNRAGFKAVYKKFWTWEKDQIQPGYIQLENVLQVHNPNIKLVHNKE